MFIGGTGYGGLMAKVSAIDGTLGPQAVVQNACSSSNMELTPGAVNIP
jgi:hypothetical protein